MWYVFCVGWGCLMFYIPMRHRISHAALIICMAEFHRRNTINIFTYGYYKWFYLDWWNGLAKWLCLTTEFDSQYLHVCRLEQTSSNCLQTSISTLWSIHACTQCTYTHMHTLMNTYTWTHTLTHNTYNKDK